MEMEEKNVFDNWNVQKQEIHFAQKEVFFSERDIFFVYLGKNIGCEQNGKGKDFKRPVLVLRKFDNNSFLAIPLTSKQKKGSFYFNFYLSNERLQTAILSQVKLLSTRRLINKIGKISSEDFKNLKVKIKDLL